MPRLPGLPGSLGFMENAMKKLTFAALLILLVITFLPWLGMTSFNTKGEPREAIVALSMVETGEYILPVSMGADIPYKPPMLAWLIVGSSYLTGGVNEYAARFPSAVATIALAMGFALFVNRRKGASAAFFSAIVMVTSVEVWRAAMACRVDMVLTACMVGAMLTMQSRYVRRGVGGVSLWAVLLLSAAMLTKGPVGVLLPCLVMIIYYMARGERFWKSALWLALTALLAVIIPAAWYVVAAERGGETFGKLVMEENFGRFTGTMSYDSHVNPWWYNFETVAAGMLPYTILGFMALFVARYRRLSRLKFSGLRNKIAAMDATDLFALTSIIVIFLFYCIPASKRSVYLLPIYPFLAYFTWMLMRRLGENYRRVLNGYGVLIGVIACLLTVGLLALPWLADALPVRAAEMATAIAGGDKFLYVALAVLPALGSVYIFRNCSRKAAPSAMILSTLETTLLIFWVVAGIILPPVLNAKSDRPVADRLETLVPADDIIYMYNPDPMLRYYTIGFYTGDRVRLLDTPAKGASATLATDADKLPRRGVLITASKHLPEIKKRHPELRITPLEDTRHRSCDTRDTILIARFRHRR